MTQGKRTGGQAWWCNERLIPEIYVQRGQTYTFTIEGGDDPRNSYKYNPFYITTSETGGYADLTPDERRVSHRIIFYKISSHFLDLLNGFLQLM